MRHYHDWKVVLWDLDGRRHVSGGFDAVRGLSWFRWLYDWWSEQSKPEGAVRLELWRGRKVVISLLVHLLPLTVLRHFLVLAMRHSNLL